MAEYSTLFTEKYLNDRLSLDELNIPNFDEKQRVIANWVNEIQSKSIYAKKEEQLQADFLNDIFGKVLDYDYERGLEQYNLEKELKSITDGTKPDGSLGYFSSTSTDTRVVIELKDAYTNLDHKQNRKNDNRTPVEQGFSYVSKCGGNCKWVIVSNFRELRLYPSNDSSSYQQFNIVDLAKPSIFKQFYALLSKNHLFLEKDKSSTEKLLALKIEQDTNISKKFYTEYKQYRSSLFNHIKENNPNLDELTILSKSQKILDRIIFICFCEDMGLLPYKVFKTILEETKNSRFDRRDTKLWERLKVVFDAIDNGYPEEHINQFNGGLFKADEIIDNLIIKDALLENIVSIEKYDFSSDLNVNILGHIFEQSISDLEEIKASFDGIETDKKKGKRKKDGIFYTPEYITKYIVNEAVGGWLETKKQELGFYELPNITEEEWVKIRLGKIQKNNKKVKTHLDFWLKYREVLDNIKVLDPACGSGSFLVQVFDYLKTQRKQVNEEIATFEGIQAELFNQDTHILSKNIYGVDLNAESVEITKLALWLKTANKNDKLTSLDNNIKCGNSLIDDKSIDEKAFDWNVEFKDIMDNGGFDVIVGNPPYVSIELIPNKDREYYKKTYNTFFKRSDLFSLFIELASIKLCKSGFVSFIVPSIILNNLSYQKIRDILLNNNRISKICYTGGGVFLDATVDTTILVIQNKDIKQIELVDARDFMNPNFSIVEADYFKKYNNTISIGSDSNDTICDKVFNPKYKTIGDCFKVFQGIVTGNNDAFIFENEDDALNKGIDKELLKPFVLGRDIYKWGIKNKERRILYIDGNVEIKEYPNTEKWLLPFKDTLNQRREAKKGVINWYALQWSRDKNDLDTQEKILIQRTRNESLKTRVVATLDGQAVYGAESLLHIIPLKDFSLYSLLGILNSKYINYVFQKKFLNVSIKGEYLKTLSIKYDSNIEILSKSMLLNNKELQDLSNKFIGLLQGDFTDLTINTSLQEWYNLDWTNFMNLLKKQKIILNGALKDDWYDRFNRFKQQAVELKTIIEKTDKEIDTLVYQLYGLTDEEIKIIEGQ